MTTDIPIPADLLATVKPSHSIPQPELRDLLPGERVVRVAGLRFILPPQFKPGDVLDENTAALFNAFYHTAIVNKFNKIKDTLLENANTTYEDFNTELQAFAQTFTYTPRTTKPTEAKPAKSEAQKAMEAFARPYFNKAMKGHGLPREEYEAKLTTYVLANAAMLKEQMEAEDALLQSLMSGLGEPE